MKDYINITAGDEFAMFIKPHNGLSASKLTEKIVHVTYRVTKQPLEKYLEEVQDVILGIQSLKNIDSYKFPALPQVAREKIMEVVIKLNNKYNLNMVEQTYVFLECIRAITKVLHQTIEAMLTVRIQQIKRGQSSELVTPDGTPVSQKQSSIVGLDGNPL